MNDIPMFVIDRLIMRTLHPDGPVAAPLLGDLQLGDPRPELDRALRLQRRAGQPDGPAGGQAAEQQLLPQAPGQPQVGLQPRRHAGQEPGVYTYA